MKNKLAYFNTRALFMGIGLSNILIEVKEYFFVSIIIGTIIGLFIINLNKNNNKIINLIGNSFLLTMASIILINIISTMYLTKMPRLLICFPIFILTIYFISKKRNCLNRIATILLIINLFLYVISILSLYKYVSFTFLESKFDLIKILSSSYKYAFYSSIPLFITKNNHQNLNKVYLLSSLTMLGIFFITYFILGPNLINIYRFPEYIVLKKVDIGNFIQNIENLISFIWLIDLIMMIFTTSYNIKKYMNNKFIYLYFIFLFILVLIITKYYILIISLYKYLHIILFIIFICLLNYKKLKYTGCTR